MKEILKLYLESYNCVNQFKSVRRAIRRGHMTVTGIVAPRRPFNNRKPTEGRSLNEFKKQVYYELTKRTRERTKEEGVQQ